MNKIEKAILFASKAHAGQYRKGTGRPYILHPIETMLIVLRLADDEDVLAAAVLHDTVENTSVTIGRIEKEFGSRVAGLVASVSEDKRKKLPAEATWRARKWEMIFRLRKADYETKLLFLGNNLSNLRDLKRDYDKVGDELWERFNKKDKSAQAWYYRECLRVLEETFEYEYYEETEEYAELADSIFGWERGRIIRILSTEISKAGDAR